MWDAGRDDGLHTQPPLRGPTCKEGVLTAATPDRDHLAARLRALRKATGISGNRFATRIGWAQSRLSRVELAKQLPNKDDIRAWVHATNNDPATEQELLDLLRRAQTEHEAHRVAYRHGGAAVQAKIGRREARAKTISVYQPSMVPGLLQTPEYIRELFDLPCGPKALGEPPEKIEEIVTGRVRRQQILYQTGRRLRFVLGEAALRTPPISVTTLIGQLDRLTVVAGLPAVELGIGPLGDPMPAFPLSGFTLLDHTVATVESLSGETAVSSPDDVDLYVKAFEQLMAAAARGPDAVALIRRVVAELSQ